MVCMSKLAAALALLTSTAAHADPIASWRPLIDEASARFGIPASWIERVMRAESGGRTTLHGRPIRSRAGAIGLMQLMPKTWSEVRAQIGLGADPDQPRDNILAGTFYLRSMYDRFGYPGLFGAYNAGPARYAAWLTGRQPLPSETVAYLAKVSGHEGRRIAPVAPRPPLLLTEATRTPASAIDPLFAIRRPAP
jgi:soluble lytic murein transglycosylase-like protein